jgi:hypothetical protein
MAQRWVSLVLRCLPATSSSVGMGNPWASAQADSHERQPTHIFESNKIPWNSGSFSPGSGDPLAFTPIIVMPVIPIVLKKSRRLMLTTLIFKWFILWFILFFISQCR